MWSVSYHATRTVSDFGEKVSINVLINIVLKFGETSRWYGRVVEIVVQSH